MAAPVTEAEGSHSARQVDFADLKLPDNLLQVLADAKGSIMRVLAQVTQSGPLHVKPDRLLLFGAGEETTSVPVTAKDSSQVGTLLVSLPCHCTGGQVNVEANEVLTVWKQRNAKRTLSWCFAATDTTILVAPISTGLQVMLTFDVVSSGTANEGLPAFLANEIDVPLASAIREAWEDSAFFPYGAHLAFNLQHSQDYPLRDQDFHSEINQHLYGSDALLLVATANFNTSPHPVAVYQIDDPDQENATKAEAAVEEVRFPMDDFEPLLEQPGFSSFYHRALEHNRLLLVSCDFKPGDWKDDSKSQEEIIREVLGARVDPKLICESFKGTSDLANGSPGVSKPSFTEWEGAEKPLVAKSRNGDCF